jgi:hypothetical protein
MEILRICIGSNDGVEIAQTHMGNTKRFLIFLVFEHQEAALLEERPNTTTDLGHATTDKMRSIIQILNDVDVLIAPKNSPNFRRIAASTRHQPVVVKARTIQGALLLVQQAFRQIHELVVERKKGKRMKLIPELGPNANAAH